jgi:hypothetical protein
VWFPEARSASGFEVPFVSIILHAVSRDAAGAHRPCILAQVDGAAPGAPPEDEEEAEEACTQLRLVPADEAARASPACACALGLGQGMRVRTRC